MAILSKPQKLEFCKNYNWSRNISIPICGVHCIFIMINFHFYLNVFQLHHGAPNDHVRHIGDLGNVRANDQGYVETKFSDQVINLMGPRSIIGRAVVIHSEVDDFGRSNHPESKKNGNTGGRAGYSGCGIIGIM